MNEGTKTGLKVQTASKAEVRCAGFPPVPTEEEEEEEEEEPNDTPIIKYGNLTPLISSSNTWFIHKPGLSNYHPNSLLHHYHVYCFLVKKKTIKQRNTSVRTHRCTIKVRSGNPLEKLPDRHVGSIKSEGVTRLNIHKIA
jgi:hypothetical protein